MNEPIRFVGAGPGAPDLITVRGAALLAAADLVIYAGSLVDERLVETATHAERVNSARLTLPEVIERMAEAYRTGKRVVRLHTGDPSIYGAVAEQFRELDKLGIPYEVVPGVSSVFAAAAELKTELTMQGLSQSVILTRAAGRTPVPENESPAQFGAAGGTLCFFLSAAELGKTAEELIRAGRSASTPAAAVYRASWPNRKIVRATLGTLAAEMEAAGIRRQAMVIIGEVLNRSGDQSRLYDPGFSTGCRAADRGGEFTGRVTLLALTRKGALRAAEIAAGLPDAMIAAPEKYAELLPASRFESFPEGGFSAAFQQAWHSSAGLVAVMATGIAVRQLAKLCTDKYRDPAVVVCDEAGRHAVSLLSGHVGGANRLAAAVARITGGEAVVTTASDVEGMVAFDEFAGLLGCRAVDPTRFKPVAAAALDGEIVELAMPRRLYRKWFAGHPQYHLADVRTDNRIRISVPARKLELELEKPRCCLGIGCRRGVSAERIETVVARTLAAAGFPMERVDRIASAEIKQEEPGLLEFARRSGLPIDFFDADALNRVAVPHPSEAAEHHLGVHSVSEAAALLAAGPGARLVIEKTADRDVTLAVAEEVFHV